MSVGTYLQNGRYEILRYISSGGFGCTYEARDTKFKSKYKTVAIKEFFVRDFCNRDTLSNSVVVGTFSKKELFEKLRNKFIDEAEALYDLQHSNIVRVTDKFEENGTAYYVMDYIDGKSLNALIEEKGCLGEHEALGYIRQVSDALDYVHSSNRLHLDVKPHNIMIDGNGKAILIDFGVSKQYDEVNGENTSTLMGHTPGYAPIEQTGRGLVTFNAACDIYALGATLYKALTGKTPIDATLRAGGLGELDYPSHVSDTMRRAIDKAMKISRVDRPQSIAEFLALLSENENPEIAILAPVETDDETAHPVVIPISPVVDDGEAVFSGNITDAADVEVVAPAPVPAKKSKLPLIVALSFVLLLVGGGIFFVTGNGGVNGSETPGIVQEKPAPGTPAPAPAFVVNTDSIVAARLQAYQDSVSAVQAAEQHLARETEIAPIIVKTFTVNGVKFRMIAVGGGKFQMGATSEQQNAYDKEKPVHSVTLSDYYIGETEVTQKLWQTVMGSNPSYFTGNSQCPVESVSWNDCQAFVNKLNDLCADQLPAGKKFRLPTEAEWEYAARGGKNSSKTQYSGSENLAEVAWYDEDGNPGSTHPVKKKAANELGLYDMSGNVWEWCFDSYASYTDKAQTNPKVDKGTGSNRVLHGGSWYGSAGNCRVAYRADRNPDHRSSSIGLRLALTP